jgi:hypothetical protein
MGTIIGEIRAVFALAGLPFTVRRRRILVGERRGQLELVLQEVLANLKRIRGLFNEEHNRFNWRGWLHSDGLSTRAWREHKGVLTTKLDGPVLGDELVADIEHLYTEFDRAARGDQRFSSDWERRLLEIAMGLDEVLKTYPTRRLDRLASLGQASRASSEIDEQIRTPASPAELQRRALAKLAPETAPTVNDATDPDQ